MSLEPNVFGYKIIASSNPKNSIPTKPLIGNMNYLSWSFSVQLWCEGQGILDQLIKQDEDIVEKVKEKREKTDANYAWCGSLFDSKCIPLFCPFQTCFSVWRKARGLYTNDISRFYNMNSRLTFFVE